VPWQCEFDVDWRLRQGWWWRDSLQLCTRRAGESDQPLPNPALTGQTKDSKAILAAAQVDMFMSGKKLQQLVTQSRKKR
jgi:hypothetical protein